VLELLLGVEELEDDECVAVVLAGELGDEECVVDVVDLSPLLLLLEEVVVPLKNMLQRSGNAKSNGFYILRYILNIV